MVNKTTLTLPKAPAGPWPKLNDPDTKFDAAGVYDVKLRLDPENEAHAALMVKLNELEAQSLASKKDELIKAGKEGIAKKLTSQSPISAEEDESGEETGMFLIKAKMKASGVSKKTGKAWTRKPIIYDRKGKKLASPPNIGAGSELKLNVMLMDYFIAKDKVCGVSIYLEAVQLITLVSFGSRSASEYGFGEEDGDDIEDGTVGSDEGSDEFAGDADADDDDM